MNTRLVMLALAGAVCLATGRGYAAGKLQEGVAEVAKGIKQVLDEEKQDAVAVGGFTGSNLHVSNAGPGIQQLLITELQALKVRVAAIAPLTVTGRYFKVGESKEANTQLSIKLTVQVLDSSGETKAELKAVLDDIGDVAKLASYTGKLPINGQPEDRRKKMDYEIDHPGVAVEGTRVKASAKSEYAVEILAKKNVGDKAQARQPKVAEGLALVPIQSGELYEVKIHNYSKYDAAVTLTIDGVDVFSFSELRNPKTNRPKYSFYVVRAGGTLTVYGWHRNNKVADSFQVTSFGKSAAAKLLVSEKKAGTITLTFAAAWEGDKKPADEKHLRSGHIEATGFGPAVKTDLNEVHRNIGVLREAVTIHYSRKD